MFVNSNCEAQRASKNLKKMLKIKLEAKNNAQVIWVYMFYFLKKKNMFKSHSIKPDHRALRKNYVYTYGAPVFAPDYSTTALAAKMWTNSQWAFYVN